MLRLNELAEVFVPDGADVYEAIGRTTDLCIGAHQDDIEIMAYGPISECFGSSTRHFCGVVVTDGAGSPRSGVYESYTDDDMKRVRVQEQKNAAAIGRYSAQILLAHTSRDVKNATNPAVLDDLTEIICAANPDVIYTHNLADKHDTHIAVVMQVLRVLRTLPAEKKPKKLIGMEVWRSLDWLCDEKKVLFDTSKFPNLAAALIGIFDSQISGGKRYDLAVIGRNCANATYFQSHAVDDVSSAAFGMDLSPLLHSDVCPCEFIRGHITDFMEDVLGRVGGFSLQ